MEGPASQASCNREYRTGTQDLKEEKDPARMGEGREQVINTEKPKLGMNSTNKICLTFTCAQVLGLSVRMLT